MNHVKSSHSCFNSGGLFHDLGVRGGNLGPGSGVHQCSFPPALVSRFRVQKIRGLRDLGVHVFQGLGFLELVLLSPSEQRGLE